MLRRALALALLLPWAGCLSTGLTVGGTIDGAGHVDWVGQASFGLDQGTARADQVWRTMFDVRFYRLGGLAHVGVGVGVDRVERSLASDRGHHLGVRLGAGGMIDPRAPRGAANPIDVRLSGEAGVAWGAVARTSEPEGSDSVTARTLGATAELVLHSKGRRWRERAALGARVGGELMLWVPR